MAATPEALFIPLASSIAGLMIAENHRDDAIANCNTPGRFSPRPSRPPARFSGRVQMTFTLLSFWKPG